MRRSLGKSPSREAEARGRAAISHHPPMQSPPRTDRPMPTSSRYTLIKGHFWIHYSNHPRQGPEPDGDTVSFAPDNLALVRGLHWLSGHGPNINARGNIPVRYEGIDALETHFRGAHQQMQFARAARDE